MGVFRAEGSDLLQVGIYMGMGIISVWALLRANTVVALQRTQGATTGNFRNSAKVSNTENGIFMEEYLFSISTQAICRKLWKLAD